jgi:hypothetical protein
MAQTTEKKKKKKKQDEINGFLVISTIKKARLHRPFPL